MNRAYEAPAAEIVLFSFEDILNGSVEDDVTEWD